VALASTGAQAKGLRRGPQAHTLAFCYPDRNLCEIRFYAGEVVAALHPAGPQGANGSTLVRTDLGKQVVDGLKLIGSREMLTLQASFAGTDRVLSVMKEFWYSPRLGVNVATKRVDPRSGVEVFTLVDITQSEPDPSLFAMAKNAHLIDYRTATVR